MSQLSNVESLLTAIAKGDSSYLVEPQSRVEALLYEIYLNGGGGGGTGDITRAEVLRLLEDKVDKLVGYGLISDEEAERLKNVDNYDDSEVRGLITDISNSIVDLKDTIKGTAEGQFIYDTDEKMTKVVPENVSKGIVAMIGGKTVKRGNLWDEQWTNGNYSATTGRPVSTSSSNVRNLNHIPVKPNTTYTFVHTTDTYRKVLWTSNMELISTVGGLTATVFTTPDDAYFMDVNFDSGYGSTYKNDTALYEGEIKDAIYGMGWLNNAPVDKITINNKVIPIPSEILNLPDYGCSAGDVYNYVDFEEMVYHHGVGSMNMGTLTYKYDSSIDKKWFYTDSIPYVKASANRDTVSNSMCSNYDVTSISGLILSESGLAVNTISAIVVKDPTIGSDINTFKTLMSGVILNYELAEEELIDISDLLLPFMLESGGTVTFENEHNLDVPNVIIYEKEMK